MRQIAAALVLWVTLPGASPSPSSPSGQAAFEAAVRRESSGDYAGAADALERLGHEHPDGAFADDALFEAALLSEERLGDPARAARLYDEVATRYPQSRLARRARTRAEFLAASLRTGEAPLAEYQRILADGTRDPAGAVLRMRRLLEAHPDFALADRALYWLGSREIEQHHEAEGVAHLLELERRFPSSEWAQRAKKARADLLLRRRHPLAARALYAELTRAPQPLARVAGQEGLAEVRATLVRWLLLVLGSAYLLAFFLVQLLATGSLARLRRVPAELLYYLPVAALFTVAGATENAAIGVCTLAIALGGGAVTWVAGAATGRRLERGPIGRGARALRALALVAAVLAVAVVAVIATGLTDVVLETLRSGPER